MPNDLLSQPSVGFWDFVWMCIETAYEATRNLFHADVQGMILGIALLAVGYLLFYLYRGRKKVTERALEDWLVNFAPLTLFVLLVFVVNLVRSPHLVYTAEREHAKSELDQVKAHESQQAIQITNLQSQLDALASPVLHGGITQFIVGSDTQHPGNCVVTIIATLWNTGAPSIATDFHLTLTLSDGTEIPTLPRLPPRQSATLYGGIGGKQSIVLYKEDYLAAKAIVQPIARGGAATGFLMAEVESCGVQQKERIDSVGTKIQLRFHDINGKEYIAEQTTRGSRSAPFPY
jgi:hypothetical protein